MIKTRVESMVNTELFHETTAEATESAWSHSLALHHARIFVLFLNNKTRTYERAGYWQEGKYHSIIRPNGGTMEVKPLR